MSKQFESIASTRLRATAGVRWLWLAIREYTRTYRLLYRYVWEVENKRGNGKREKRKKKKNRKKTLDRISSDGKISRYSHLRDTHRYRRNTLCSERKPAWKLDERSFRSCPEKPKLFPGDRPIKSRTRHSSSTGKIYGSPSACRTFSLPLPPPALDRNEFDRPVSHVLSSQNSNNHRF